MNSDYKKLLDTLNKKFDYCAKKQEMKFDIGLGFLSFITQALLSHQPSVLVTENEDVISFLTLVNLIENDHLSKFNEKDERYIQLNMYRNILSIWSNFFQRIHAYYLKNFEDINDSKKDRSEVKVEINEFVLKAEKLMPPSLKKLILKILSAEISNGKIPDSVSKNVH